MIFLRRANVDEPCPCRKFRRKLVREKRNTPAQQNIFCCIAGHIHGIFRCGIRRCIGQLKLFQIRNRERPPDGRGKNIDALVHALCTDCLRPQYNTVRKTENQLECKLLCPRIIGHMMAWENHRKAIILSVHHPC